ncbi:importin alpha [Anaeramoeba flamelloides]|uniref:Importin alpha n=1 Tax=Anaeramoeba flamelloides TaxID=1746091 RepID=A0ABQ8YS50_9EUKA|nr:importin alpha [Anaeramoeba flamelloides]
MIFHQNYQTVSDACWGLKYLTNGNIEIIKLVAKPKITKRFIDLLRINEPQIQIPALRCIINILAGSDEGIQQVIDSKGIEVLIELLQNQETQFRKESCWALSNICSGTPLQIQYLLDQKIIPYIIGMIETDPFAIKKEAIFLLSNIFHQGNEEQIEYLISLETLPIFCEMISCNEISIEKVCLGALKRALLFGKNLEQNKNNIIAQYLEERNIIQVISNLENSRDNEISSLSTQIIDGYFSESNNLAQMDEMDELN